MRQRFITAAAFSVAALLTALLFFDPPGVTPAESAAPKTPAGSVCIAVKPLSQYPALPTGCEATAAAMVLNYYGVTLSPAEFAAHWLPQNTKFYQKGGTLYGPNPNEFFCGNPFNKAAYGCYAPVIAKAINLNSTACKAQVLYGQTLKQLSALYTQNGYPLLIWATMQMRPSATGKTWRLPNGQSFTWRSCEHCLVLVGQTATHYLLNDPQTGQTEAYEKALCEQRFAELYSQAVLITKTRAAQ